NVSNPLGGINSPGSTQNLCAPTANLQFAISNWGSNSLDTTYTVNYGDGTPTVVLTQTQMVASSYFNVSNPSGSTNYPIPHIYTTSSCPAPSFQVSLDVTNACGTTPFTLGNISILTKPTANFTSPPKGCVNTSILFTNTTISGYGLNCAQNAIYTWNFGDGTPTVSLPVGPPQNISHTFTTPGTYTVTLTAQNFCGTTIKTEIICIEPPLTPQFNLNTNNGCIPLAVTATNATNLANQCSAPAYLWQVTHTPLYCAASTVTIPNQTTANATFNFTVPGTYTITLSTTNSCGTTTTSQTVTVKKPPTVTVAPISNSCGTANITPVGNVTNCAPTGGTLTYSWLFPGGTPSSSNALNPGTIAYPAGGPYTVSFTATNECGVSNTATQSFTVNTAPVITNSVLSQTICSGSSTTVVNLTANPAGTTFSWTASATAGITGFTSSGTGNTIPIQTITTTNTNAGTVTYVITPTFNGCVGPTVNYVVNVNPAPSITTQPVSSSVCLGGVPTVLTVVLNSSAITPTYQWYSNTTSSTSGGTLIPGATNATYSPPSSAVGTLYYYCVITLSSGGCSSLTSQLATVTINPLPTIVTQPQPTQSICVGGVITALTASYTGGIGTAAYQWYSNTTNSNSGGTLISGATSATYTPPVFNTAGTYYYYVVVTLNGNGCGNTASNTAEVIVLPDPTITSQPLATQTQCQGTTAAALTVSVSGGVGTFSYQWYSNTSNNTTTGAIITGATNSTYTPPTTTVGTRYYYCIITQTGSGCSVTSAVAIVTVVAAPSISAQPLASQTLCLNGTPTPLTIAYINGLGTPNYQWYSNTSSATSGGSLIPGATNATYNPPASTVGTVYYYCVVTFTSGGCTSATSNAAAVIINDLPTINTQPLPTQNICVGGIISALTGSYTGGVGTAGYQWYSNTTNSNIGGTLISGATSATYAPPVFNTAGTYYYYAVITLSGNGCGVTTSNTAEVIVLPDPTITTQPLVTQTQCQNTPANVLEVVANGGSVTFSYLWYSNENNNTTPG
ncbi:MAG: PKD domain-containing protein, partial [Bacteroidia bacterium]